jgi:hypothetical protein
MCNDIAVWFRAQAAQKRGLAMAMARVGRSYNTFTRSQVRKMFQAYYQAQKIFIMAQKQLMPPGWNPIDSLKSVNHQKGTGQFDCIQAAIC